MLNSCTSLIGCLFRLLALLLAALFVVMVVLVLILLNADQLLLSPGVYQTALVESRIYEQLPGLAAEQIYTQMHYQGTGVEAWSGGNPLQQATRQAQDCSLAALGQTAYRDILGGIRPPTQPEMAEMAACGVGSAPGGEGGPPAFFTGLSRDQWTSLLTQLLPAQWLRTTAESAITQVFALIDDPAAAPRIMISLREFKQRFTGQTGVDVVSQLLDALPPCPAEAILSIENPDQLLQCRPPDEILAQAEPQIQQALQQAATGIPNEVDLMQPLREGGLLSANSWNLPASPRMLLLYGRWIVRLSPILCLGLLLLVALLAVRSWKGWLQWWGVPLFLAGLSTLALAIFAWGGLELLLTLARQDLPANFAPGILDTFASVLTSVVHRFALFLGGEGAVIGFVGLAMVVTSLLLPGSRRSAPRPLPPAAPPPPPTEPQPPAAESATVPSGEETVNRGIFG
jgi:hypothetical protein